MDAALVYALFAALILTLIVVTVRLRGEKREPAVPRRPSVDNRQAPP
jgi:hypothetical protein